MDIKFMLCIIIWYYFVYFIAEIVPTLAIGGSFSWPLYPSFWHIPMIVGFITF